MANRVSGVHSSFIAVRLFRGLSSITVNASPGKSCQYWTFQVSEVSRSTDYVLDGDKWPSG